jgi:hypothetical protein
MATQIKLGTIDGTKTFNDLPVEGYDDVDSMKMAIKSIHKMNSSWQYITSTNGAIANTEHTITIPKSMGRTGDFYLEIQLPANTYVSHTMSSMLEEVRIDIGAFQVKYTGEDIDMLLAHLNKKTESDYIYAEGNNSVSAVSAATWYTLPLWFLGSKLIYSMNSSIDEPQNIFFPNHKLLADFTWTFKLYPIAKFATTGTTATGTVRLRFKQYDFLDLKASPNVGNLVEESTFIAPYFYNVKIAQTLTDATEASFQISQAKNDGEISEMIFKVANNTTYKATAPLLYTTEGLDAMRVELSNIRIYDGLNPSDIRIQYFNEYCHSNVMLLTATAYKFFVTDWAESPMLLHNGSIGSPGINFTKEDPVVTITPTANSLSSTACTVYLLVIYKAIYKIFSNGTIERFTKLK